MLAEEHCGTAEYASRLNTLTEASSARSALSEDKTSYITSYQVH